MSPGKRKSATRAPAHSQRAQLRQRGGKAALGKSRRVPGRRGSRGSISSLSSNSSGCSHPGLPDPRLCSRGLELPGVRGRRGTARSQSRAPPSDRVYPHFMTPVNSLCSAFHFYRKHSVFSLRPQQAINPSCLAAVLNIAQKSHTFQNHWVCNETEPRSHFEVPAFAVTKPQPGWVPAPSPRRVTAQPSRANGTVTLSAVEMPPE